VLASEITLLVSVPAEFDIMLRQCVGMIRWKSAIVWKYPAQEPHESAASGISLTQKSTPDVPIVAEETEGAFDGARR
jgi:hypothetical protein